MRLLRLIIGWFLFLVGALHTISGLVYLIWIRFNPEFVSVQPMMISSVILGIPPIAAVASARRQVAGKATISSAVLRSASDRQA